MKNKLQIFCLRSSSGSGSAEGFSSGGASLSQTQQTKRSSVPARPVVVPVAAPGNKKRKLQVQQSSTGGSPPVKARAMQTGTSRGMTPLRRENARRAGKGLDAAAAGPERRSWHEVAENLFAELKHFSGLEPVEQRTEFEENALNVLEQLLTDFRARESRSDPEEFQSPNSHHAYPISSQSQPMSQSPMDSQRMMNSLPFHGRRNKLLMNIKIRFTISHSNSNKFLPHNL